jgi:hypothetical protein
MLKKFLDVYVKGFGVKGGVESKNNVQHSKKTREGSDLRKSPIPGPREHGSGSSKRLWSVGLIQSNETLDLTVPRQENTQLWCTCARENIGKYISKSYEENTTILTRFSL